MSPADIHTKPDGTVVRTLWGELAWQLGGKEGYAMVRSADEKAVSPGDSLRLLYNKSDLPAGDFDAHFTFAQTLSESAKLAEKTLLEDRQIKLGCVPTGRDIGDVWRCVAEAGRPSDVPLRGWEPLLVCHAAERKPASRGTSRAVSPGGRDRRDPAPAGGRGEPLESRKPVAQNCGAD